MNRRSLFCKNDQLLRTALVSENNKDAGIDQVFKKTKIQCWPSRLYSTSPFLTKPNTCMRNLNWIGHEPHSSMVAVPYRSISWVFSLVFLEGSLTFLSTHSDLHQCMKTCLSLLSRLLNRYPWTWPLFFALVMMKLQGMAVGSCLV